VTTWKQLTKVQASGYDVDSDEVRFTGLADGVEVGFVLPTAEALHLGEGLARMSTAVSEGRRKAQAEEIRQMEERRKGPGS
jgi:hypothetical protein